jgi:hypothetical protein
MTAQDKEAFLARWSRLKREQAQEEPAAPAPQAKDEAAPAPLPPVDSLTPQSDFAPFMQPQVAEALRRVALKKLFADPRFNVPDLNEAYSGDWTGGEPIGEAMLKSLNQARTVLFREEEEERKRRQAEAGAPAEQEPKEKPKEEDGAGRQDA